jgi:carbon-monoxide dehydrogenase medium subunit
MEAITIERPDTVAEASRLAAADGDARLFAGGQTLLPSMRLGLLAPTALIDLSAIGELRSIETTGAGVTIGAMCTHATVASSSEVRSQLPALARLAGEIADRQVRNIGTLGGSLANSDPAADYPAAALALGATIHTSSRQIGADDFFRGLFETELRRGEIITAVSFPRAEQAAYVKFRQPASRYALVGVFVARFPRGVRVAVTGAGPMAFRLAVLELALAKKFTPQACESFSVPAGGLNHDTHGSAAYRASLIPIIARRAVAQALA